VLRLYEPYDQKFAIQFVDHTVEKLPFPVEQIQTDNGSEFQTLFHWHALDLGIRHIYIKPATPRLNGKVERSHRIDNEEFYRLLDGVVIDNTNLFRDRLQECDDTMIDRSARLRATSEISGTSQQIGQKPQCWVSQS
jgi:transposase InsO family protein